MFVWRFASKSAQTPSRNKLISRQPMVTVPDIKLIRTDTTLDLSQEAEKNTFETVPKKYLYFSLSTTLSVSKRAARPSAFDRGLPSATHSYRRDDASGGARLGRCWAESADAIPCALACSARRRPSRPRGLHGRAMRSRTGGAHCQSE